MTVIQRLAGIITGCCLIILTACQAVDPPLDPPAPHPLLGTTTGPYVDPDSIAAQWVAAHPHHPLSDEVERDIASKAIARWVQGPGPAAARETRRYVSAATTANSMPMLVLNRVSDLSCDTFEANAQHASDDMEEWTRHVAEGIAEREAIVIVEPRALSNPHCRSAHRDARTAAVAASATTLTQHAPNAHVLLAAGDGTGIGVATMVKLLKAANIQQTAGFALNVGRYTPHGQTERYGATLRKALGEATGRTDYVFAIDTSRNGAGPLDGTCNPPGAELGHTSSLGGPLKQAQTLWLTTPGISDGPCGTAPRSPRGTFNPDLAHQLITGA
ncbi:glycoside hydrolase family 6 protein [Prauserella alba]|uniref:Glucanase n=1 Tax=Prauserella alba TaxID=176898 RepID=A0ABP4G665_9PSEU|nr:glycoside hydrolase family 6 protein [Prauserella alba]MCP2182205.1 endoglucanase [Prauserella alba]